MGLTGRAVRSGAITLAAGGVLALVLSVSARAQDGQGRAAFDAAVAKVATLNTASDPRQAIALIDGLLAQADELGATPVQRADLVRKRALALVALYEFEEAIIWLERAVDAYRATPDDVRIEVTGQLVNNIGHAYSALKQWDKAIATFSNNLPALESVHGRVSREYAGALFGLAATHYRSGNWTRAIELTREAADLERKVDRRGDAGDHSPDTVTVVSSLGTMLDRFGLSEEAMVYTREAADYALGRFGPEDQMTILALSNLARQLSSAGRLREAEDITRRVLEQRIRLLGRDHLLVARTLKEFAEIKFRLGEIEEGRLLLREAQSRFAANPDESSPASGGAIAVRLALLEEDAGARRALLDAAISTLLAAVPATHPDIASARVRAAEAAWALPDAEMTAGYLALAQPVLRAALAADHPDRVSADMLQAALERAAGAAFPALAQSAFDRAYEALLDDAVAPAERASSVLRFHKPLALYAGMASDAGDLASAFSALQLMQLTEMDSASRAQSVAAGLPAARAARLFAIRDAIAQARFAQGDLAAAQSVAEPTAERAAQARLEARRSTLERLYAELALSDPASLAAIRPEPVPLAMVQKQLGADEAVLIAVPTDEALLTIAVTASGALFSSAPASRSTVSALVQTARTNLDPALMADRAFDLAAAQRLAGLVMPAPVLAFLGGASRLHARLGGDLAQVPLSAYPLGSAVRQPGKAKLADVNWADANWAVQRFAISYPLDLRQIDKRSGWTRSMRFAGIGAPQLDGPTDAAPSPAQVMRGGAVQSADLRAMSALPGAMAELNSLAGLFGAQNSRLLVGADASEAAVRAFDFSPYSVLVFATHALVAGELRAAAEPGLVLTPPADSAAAEDGYLTASEISLLDMDADWVILSGCNTAAGSASSEPALTGLARAFVDAGARSLLVSHWRVRDDAAAFLSVTTVKGALGGLARADALRAAQLQMIAGRSAIPGADHPAIWAPFVIIQP